MVCYAFMLLMFLAAKRNKIVNSFLVVLTGLLLWTGGSAFMRAQLWPQYEFWYRFIIWNLTASVRILPFYSGFWRCQGRYVGKIYLAVILICLVANIWNGFFLACPELVKKMEHQPLYTILNRRFWYYSFLLEPFCYTCL